MDANNSITAAVFFAFLKCPTKAHLLAIGEPAPTTFFTDIEARISLRYKSAVTRSLPAGVALAETLEFGQLLSRDQEVLAHPIDCKTAIYNLVRPLDEPGVSRSRESTESGSFVSVLFSPWDKPDVSDSLLVCFGALALAQITGILADTGTVIYGAEHRRKTVKIGDYAARTRETINAIVVTCNSQEPPPLVLNKHWGCLRLPAEMSRPRHRTGQFEPAQRDDRQGAGEIPLEGNLLDNAAVVRLPPATAQAQ
jgi:hypothetical protein